MSQLNNFIRHVRQDPALQERLKEAENNEVLVEHVLAEGKVLGYDLDATEIRQRLRATQDQVELSDADLDLVSGAGSWLCSGKATCGPC